MDPLNSIDLILKTPNQQVGDIQLKCNEEWTVKMLKDHLQNVYPSNPKSSAQRLIYLGKLLHDHVILKEVFNGLGAKTIHIVCSEMNGAHNPVKSTPASSQSMSTNTQQASSSTTTTVSSSTIDDNRDTTDGLRFRGVSTPPISSTLNQSPTFSLPQFAHSQFSGEGNMSQQNYQQLWSQSYQLQMQQYYAQIQQWQLAMASGQLPYMYNQMNLRNTPTLSQTPPGTPATPTTPVAPAAAQNDNRYIEQQPPRNDAPNDNAPINAGPGGAIMPADEEENGNRDWLDVLYMSLRALMLLSIIYFYSSTSRFILVTLLWFIVYLYQAGWLTQRQVEQPEENIQVGDNNIEEDLIDGAENLNDNDTNNETSNENTDESLSTEQRQQQDPVIQEPERPSAFQVFCTFCKTFVTSLIPTAPPPIQQN